MNGKSINKRVGEYLRIIRLSKNLSLEALSDDLQISVSTLSNLERGETEMTVSRLYQILEMLNIEVLDFFKNIQEDNNEFVIFSDGSHNYQKSNNTVNLLEEIRLIKLEIANLKGIIR